MVIAEALKYIENNIGSTREAQLLLCHILKTDMLSMTLNRLKELSENDIRLVREFTERRKKGEPVQYIMGICEFMSLEFLINKSTLIPRSDTETLVEYIIDKIGNRECRVLDIGTGSGCIGISIAKYCINAAVDCIDISNEALDVARKNANKNVVIEKMNFIQKDILSEIIETKYDCIVSNPPYIRPDVIKELEVQVRDYEPYSALYGGEDGLIFYRRITDIADSMLKCGGIIAFEIGYDQASSVCNLMKSRFTDVQVIKDLCGNDRVVTGYLK